MLPVNVTWMITNRCNYNCEFCFRFFERKELDYKTAVKITDKLAAAGLRKISWAGGEPLLWPRMMDLIDYTHQHSIDTMLISNGELITQDMIARFKENLDWLNLPLDGSSPEMSNAMTRKEGHFQRVIKIFDQLKDSGVKLKINTVASKINIDDIVNMVPLIKRFNIKRWKIFQFYPVRGDAVDSADKFSLSPKRFEQVRKTVTDMIDSQDCMVVFENNEQLEESYFALTPDGLVYVSHKGKDIFIGDLKTDDVNDIWNHPSLNKDKYWERSKWVLEQD